VLYTGNHHNVLRYECRRGWLDNGEPRCIGFGGMPVDEALAQEVLVRRVKALVYRGLKVPPGNWFAPPGSNRSGSGGNEAAGASGVEGRLKATRQVAQAVM